MRSNSSSAGPLHRVSLKVLSTAVTAAAIVLFVGCSGMPSEVHYEPLVEVSFEAEQGPAEETGLSDQELIRRGYVKIGEMEAECVEVIEWETDRVEERDPEMTATETLLYWAAQKGGQLVQVGVRDQPNEEKVERSTFECEHWVYTEKQIMVQRWDSYKGEYYYEPEYVTEKTCKRYKKIKGVKRFTLSRGDVWRKKDW